MKLQQIKKYNETPYDHSTIHVDLKPALIKLHFETVGSNRDNEIRNKYKERLFEL